MNNKNQSITSTIGGIVIVVILIVGGFYVAKALTGSDSKSNGEAAQDAKDSSKKEGPGSSSATPVAISLAEVQSLSAEDFAKKYDGKWIAFDGLIIATTKMRDDRVSYTGLTVGDNPNDSNFTDMGIFQVPAEKSTFDDRLQSYASVTPPERLSDWPKVHVVGRVERFDQDTLRLYLSATPNADGESPSVTAR